MSFTFANLPGVQVVTVDGGLAAVNTPRTKSVMVVGTSAIGPANSPFQVVDPAIAAQAFGLNGTLIRSMSEVGAFSDNIFLFRMGTKQGTFLVGKQLASSPALGPVNVVLSATRLGGVSTIVLSTTVDASVVQGGTIQLEGCHTESFDGAWTVASITTTSATNDTITFDQIGSPDVATEDETVAYQSRDDFSVNGLVTLTITGGVATLDWSAGTANAFTPSSVEADDTIVLASLAPSAAAAYNGTYKVITKNSTSITFGSGLANHALITLTAGTFQADTLRSSTPVVVYPGYLITLGEVADSANTDYKVWYDGSGVLYLWLNGNLVFANDTGNSVVVNTGDSTVTGSTAGGLAIKSANPASLAHAITLQAATTFAGADTQHPDPVYVAPVTGIGLTGRQTYWAQQDALDLLQGFPIDLIVTPNALLDQANIAYYVSSDSTTAANNPATNPDALDWLRTTKDSFGNKTYLWASESTDSAGNPYSGPHTFSDAATRLAANFHEVNFGYQLARFCAAQSEAPQAQNAGCIGFIGTSGPANLSNFSLPNVRNWIGFLPTYDPVSGNPSVPGSGLLGIAYLVGTTAGKLHAATSDSPSGFRLPGFFTTVSDEYDGGPEFDENGSKIDIGAYLSVQGDWVLQSNGFGQYVGNIAGVVAGLVSSLDQKNAQTNKPLAGVQQLYRASLTQLDSLTFADINVLRFKGTGNLPVCLHDKTAATAASDYIFVLRQRIKFLMVQTLLQEADAFIGNASNDGLQLNALKTALDSALLNLQKRGYISKYSFTITSTAAEQKVGHASIKFNFVPANELVQLRATVGINLAGL